MVIFNWLKHAIYANILSFSFYNKETQDHFKTTKINYIHNKFTLIFQFCEMFDDFASITLQISDKL